MEFFLQQQGFYSFLSCYWAKFIPLKESLQRAFAKFSLSEIYCSALEAPARGDVTGGNRVGDIAIFTCMPGFSLGQSQENATCNASGHWDEPSPQCEGTFYAVNEELESGWPPSQNSAQYERVVEL